MSEDKVILVTRKTRLEGLIERFNTRAQAQFYLQRSVEQSGEQRDDFALYEREHETYHAALAELRRGLQGLAKVHVFERTLLPNFLFAPDDLVVTIGVDGLVVNTAKYLSGQPLIAVNPDPEHIDGILLPFRVAEALAVVRRVLRGQHALRPITMAQATLRDGQSLLAFNDFFVGARTHVSARYRIRVAGTAEDQSSSGIIVATGAGSTGWLSSAFNMANGLVAEFEPQPARLVQPQLPWDADRLMFVVREPFLSKTSGASIVCGTITGESPLVVESAMPEDGVIFSDGVMADYLAFNAGAVASIGLAEQKTNLVVG